jgi:hypothetical protein
LNDTQQGAATSSEAAPNVSSDSNSTSTFDLHRISTTFASGNRGYGSMFDVSNSEGDYAVITSIDFHTNLMSDMNVIVYTKEGSFQGSEFKPVDWTIIANTTVTGQGYYKRTAIPPTDMDQVSIRNGKTRAFYVSINTPNLLYSNVEEDTGLGDAVYQNNGVAFHVGSGLQGTFSNVFQPRLHNGGISFYHKSSTTSTESTGLEPIPSTGGEAYQYETVLGGDSASFGIMFSIQNKHPGPIYITSFAFHTELQEDCAVEIYSITGDYSGKEQSPSEWMKICTTSIQALGMNNWSKVPASKIQQVQILSGKMQSFYITLEQPNLKYSLPSDLDLNLESLGDNHIGISHCSAVAGYPFGLNISPRRPVVQIHYEVISEVID